MNLEKNYFKAPNDVFEVGLDPYEGMVYLYLTRCANNSTAFPSFPTIAEHCGMSERTAKSVVKRLEQKNLIRVKRNRLRWNRSLVNNYEIMLPQKYIPDMEL
jgi:DNA-binding MarR family transcriptional regulator